VAALRRENGEIVIFAGARDGTGDIIGLPRTTARTAN
jgi:hypothetical protein